MELFGFILAASAVGFAGFVAVVGATAYGLRRLFFAAKGEPYVPLLGSQRKRPYRYLDAETGVKPEDITRVLRKYLGVDVVGSYAKNALQAMETAEAKTESFQAVLDSKFTKGSLSWEKFASAGSAVYDAIVRNCTLLANRIQAFDPAEYRSIERSFNRGPWKRTPMPTAAQAERRELYRQSIGEMNSLIVANDNLLLELGKLTAELDKLDSIDSVQSNSRVVEEVRTLIEETKYYSQ